MYPKYSMLTKHSTPLAQAGMLYQLWPTAAIHTHSVGASLSHYTCFFFAKAVTTSKSYQMSDRHCVFQVGFFH